MRGRVAVALVVVATLTVAGCVRDTATDGARTPQGTTPETEAPAATMPVAGTASTGPEPRLTADLFVAPSDFGPGYAVSSTPGKKPYLGPATTDGGPMRVDAVTEVDASCRPTAWTSVEPTQWAFTWFDAPDGGLASQELLVYPSEDDAAAVLESARVTLGASMNDPACQGRNLIAPSSGASPDTWELRFPVTAIDPDCGVGDDCHAVITELDPCDPQGCTPVTQILAREGSVTVSIMYYGPEGHPPPVPIADLVPVAKRAAQLVAER